MGIYAGMRYPQRNKTQIALAPKSDLKQMPSQKFVNVAVTISDDILTSGDMDLNTKLIQHPSATYFVRVQGVSMQYSGILPNDVLVVDRALEPQHKSIVLATYNGDFILKRYTQKDNKVLLYSDNAPERPLSPNPEENFEVWGVVTYIIHEA